MIWEIEYEISFKKFAYVVKNIEKASQQIISSSSVIIWAIELSMLFILSICVT